MGRLPLQGGPARRGTAGPLSRLRALARLADRQGREASGSCAGPREPGERVPRSAPSGWRSCRRSSRAWPSPDMVVSGTVNSPAARRVRIVYSGRTARSATCRWTSPAWRAAARARGGGRARGTFIAFVGGEQAARDRLGDCLDLRALETVAGQNPIERCAELYPAVKRVPGAPRASCHAGIPAADRAAQRRTERCIGRPPPSPVVAIVLRPPRPRARRARAIRSPSRPRTRRRSSATPPYRGQGKGERGKLPLDKDASGRPVVLVSGRTPTARPSSTSRRSSSAAAARCTASA